MDSLELDRWFSGNQRGHLFKLVARQLYDVSVCSVLLAVLDGHVYLSLAAAVMMIREPFCI